MEAWVEGFLIVGGAVAASLGGLLLVRRSVARATLEQHHEVVGFVYAVVGICYGVLLAFAAVVAWEGYDEARMVAAAESDVVADLLRSAEVFDPSSRDLLNAALRAYVRSVIESEWPAMARGEHSATAAAAFDTLWSVYRSVRPRDAVELAWYTESIRRLDDLGDARRLRLLDAHSDVPGVLWVVLVAGAALTIGFSYLFAAREFVVQALMTAALAALIALVLFLVLALENPFSGPLRIPPTAFVAVVGGQ